MRLKHTLLFFLIVCTGESWSQTTSWDFSTGTQGWTLTHSLSSDVNGGIYYLTITDADPYMLSPGSLNIDATAWGRLQVRLQNISPSTQFQLFWITTTDAVWNQEKSIFYTVNAYDSVLTDYTINLLGNTGWSGTISQIRLDMGDLDAVGDSVLLNQVNFNEYEMGLDNGFLHVRLDMSRGGAICYISTSGSTRSIVNIGDEGRYVQQSYYAGNSLNRQSEGQDPNWSPWPWNPIQVGDAYHNRAPILNYTKGTDTLYTKCTPLQWDMDSMTAEAEMEQWTSLNANIITVHNRLTVHRTDTIYGETPDNQELPAVYVISALPNLYSYFGTQPFTNAPAKQVPVVNLSSGFWGVYDSTSEHWMAFLDNTLWGIGVYNPNATGILAGLSGVSGQEATSGSTNYIAPYHLDTLLKNCVFEYSYDLIIGSLDEIRTAVYQLHNNALTGATPFHQQDVINLFPNPASNTVSVQINHTPQGKVLLELYNLQSRLLFTDKINTAGYEMNIANLSKGIYFIRLTGNENVWYKRLVVE